MKRISISKRQVDHRFSQSNDDKDGDGDDKGNNELMSGMSPREILQ